MNQLSVNKTNCYGDTVAGRDEVNMLIAVIKTWLKEENGGGKVLRSHMLKAKIKCNYLKQLKLFNYIIFCPYVKYTGHCTFGRVY